jgi:hypothetical protein
VAVPGGQPGQQAQVGAVGEHEEQLDAAALGMNIEPLDGEHKGTVQHAAHVGRRRASGLPTLGREQRRWLQRSERPNSALRRRWRLDTLQLPAPRHLRAEAVDAAPLRFLKAASVRFPSRANHRRGSGRGTAAPLVAPRQRSTTPPSLPAPPPHPQEPARRLATWPAWGSHPSRAAATSVASMPPSPRWPCFTARCQREADASCCTAAHSSSSPRRWRS